MKNVHANRFPIWMSVVWFWLATAFAATAADFAVSPVVGPPPPIDERLARLVAEELQYVDIPATTDLESDHLFVLKGEATSKSDWTGTYTKIVWQIQDEAGNKLSELNIEDTAPFVSPDAPWDALDMAALKRLAQKTAEEIESAQDSLDQAAAAVPPATKSGEAAKPPRGRLAIGVISGAPGDGNEALALALAQALKQYRVTVEANPGPGIYRTKAQVSVTNKDVETDTVRIEWRLMGPNGQSYGTVEQENDVPAGSVNQRWGDTAVYAAAGAGDGLVALMEQLGTTPPNVNE